MMLNAEESATDELLHLQPLSLDEQSASDLLAIITFHRAKLSHIITFLCNLYNVTLSGVTKSLAPGGKKLNGAYTPPPPPSSLPSPPLLSFPLPSLRFFPSLPLEVGPLNSS